MIPDIGITYGDYLIFDMVFRVLSFGFLVYVFWCVAKEFKGD